MKRTFLQGLSVILPLFFTLYIVYWLASLAEKSLGALIATVLPHGLRLPGLGVVAALFCVLVAGLVMKLWFARLFLRWAESLLERVPLVKTLYGSVRDLITFAVGSGSKPAMKQVVTVALCGGGVKLLGFVTREDFGDLPHGLGGEEVVAVYLPMSYQIGGFTILVPKSETQSIDMSLEDAMRFAITGGVHSGNPPGATESPSG
ncbi:MAG: DUF502 domain-containing protein [Planctomycetes bacterium]|nr:DUF502 domain-containing protein [Planctomycetota bacterium]